jgi:hypothetical protein
MLQRLTHYTPPVNRKEFIGKEFTSTPAIGAAPAHPK